MGNGDWVSGTAPADIAARKPGAGAGTGGGGSGGSFQPGGIPGGPTSGPGAGLAASVALMVPPPFWIKPPMASDFLADVWGTFSRANTPAVIAGSAFQVPAENVGYLRSITLNVNNLLVTSSLTWRLRFNQVPVTGWNALTVFPRVAASYAKDFGPDECFIQTPEGALIDVEIIVAAADAATYLVGISYHGWYVSKRMVEQFASIYRF